MRILVTGREGQVARSLAERAGERADIVLTFAARPAVDLGEPGSLARAIERARPDLVINAAAFTAVDRAQIEPELARRINAEAAGEGAQAAAAVGATFIQLSTDYVFDGSGDKPWREDDPIAPINTYGATKAEGERKVLAASPSHAVVRTSWLVSSFGTNFVKTMLRLATHREAIAVVGDQRGSPTSTFDLANALLAMAADASNLGGVWHVAGSGNASWAEFAAAVMETSASLGGASARIDPIPSSAFPTAARRPHNSVLDCSKFYSRFAWPMPEWRGAIDRIVERLTDGR